MSLLGVSRKDKKALSCLASTWHFHLVGTRQRRRGGCGPSLHALKSLKEVLHEACVVAV